MLGRLALVSAPAGPLELRVVQVGKPGQPYDPGFSQWSCEFEVVGGPERRNGTWACHVVATPWGTALQMEGERAELSICTVAERCAHVGERPAPHDLVLAEIERQHPAVIAAARAQWQIEPTGDAVVITRGPYRFGLVRLADDIVATSRLRGGGPPYACVVSAHECLAHDPRLSLCEAIMLAQAPGVAAGAPALERDRARLLADAVLPTGAPVCMTMPLERTPRVWLTPAADGHPATVELGGIDDVAALVLYNGPARDCGVCAVLQARAALPP